MNTSPRILIVLAIAAATAASSHASPPPKPRPASESLAPLAPVALAAIAGDTEAISKLRAAGPPGLEIAFTAAAPAITALRENKSRLEDPANAPLRAALDGIARQRDAYASGLYWYTDLEAAKAEAKRTRRPILSLRLLGNLDDEYSCANSRFFRTALYAHRSVSALLRRGYVLHWKSVRPVPILTIDMGDGRRIKRTITGNSIHYVLDSEGRVLDALPGNYTPLAFIAGLVRIHNNAYGADAAQRRLWHGREADTLCTEWLTDAVKTGVYGKEAEDAMNDPATAAKLIDELRPKAFPAFSAGSQKFLQKQTKGSPEAPREAVSRFGIELSRFTEWEPRFDFNPTTGALDITPPDPNADPPLMPILFPKLPLTKIERIKPFPYPTEFDPPKGMVERPLVKQMAAPAAEAALDLAKLSADGASLSLAERMTNERWARLTFLHRAGVSTLDERSCRMMMAKLPETMLTKDEMETGVTRDDNSPLARMRANFEAAITRDMVRNEYYFHTLIHQWLEEDKDGTLTNEVEALNKRVYAELFLTPDYDEWLGLVPEDTYTALEKDGCACDKGAPPMNTTRKAKP